MFRTSRRRTDPPSNPLHPPPRSPRPHAFRPLEPSPSPQPPTLTGAAATFAHARNTLTAHTHHPPSSPTLIIHPHHPPSSPTLIIPSQVQPRSLLVLASISLPSGVLKHRSVLATGSAYREASVLAPASLQPLTTPYNPLQPLRCSTTPVCALHPLTTLTPPPQLPLGARLGLLALRGHL